MFVMVSQEINTRCHRLWVAIAEASQGKSHFEGAVAEHFQAMQSPRFATRTVKIQEAMFGVTHYKTLTESYRIGEGLQCGQTDLVTTRS